MEQEDAFDLLRCMLDSLIIGEEKWQKINKSSEKQLGKQRNTLTEKLFGGYLSNYRNKPNKLASVIILPSF